MCSEGGVPITDAMIRKDGGVYLGGEIQCPANDCGFVMSQLPTPSSLKPNPII